MVGITLRDWRLCGTSIVDIINRSRKGAKWAKENDNQTLQEPAITSYG